MFEVLLIIRINNRVGLWGILNFRLLRDAFPYRLVSGIPLNKGVPYPLQSKVRPPLPHLGWTFLALQISLNVWLAPCLLHWNIQYILQPPHQVKAVVAHQHPKKPYRHTQHVALYPATFPSLLALPLLSGLENMPTPIPNPAARVIITNPLLTRATEKNQRQRHSQLQQQAVSTPRWIVTGSRGIHRFSHSDMTRHVFATGGHLEL